MDDAQPRTRIQEKNRAAILDAALDVFSAEGFRGATLDQIAQSADLSKPNVLYYFGSKEAIYTALLDRLLDTWMAPLAEIDPAGEPVAEILSYLRRKLAMSRDYPRESRLFAQEIVQGAPRIMDRIEGELARHLDETARIVSRWIDEGRLAPVEPRHLIFSIWATTQHYADFDAQVGALVDTRGGRHFDAAERFLVELYARGLAPR